MVLARIEGAQQGSRGLTLFAVPWRREDGTLNGLRIRRLKDKLGVRAVPSGEIEFDGALAYVVGDPAKGFYYMMEALNLSRICNAVASIGIMRRALLESTCVRNPPKCIRQTAHRLSDGARYARENGGKASCRSGYRL